MKLSKQALRTLRKRLPPGAIQDIADELGLSQPTVSMVLLGSRSNEAVIQLAIKKAEAHEAKQAALEQRAMGRIQPATC